MFELVDGNGCSRFWLLTYGVISYTYTHTYTYIIIYYIIIHIVYIIYYTYTHILIYIILYSSFSVYTLPFPIFFPSSPLFYSPIHSNPHPSALFPYSPFPQSLFSSPNIHSIRVGGFIYLLIFSQSNILVL